MLQSPLRVYWPVAHVSGELRKSGRFFRNLQSCPHCARLGRRGEVDRLNESTPMIFRSDGDKFHLVLGDRPIAFPNENGTIGMMTAGFWYVRERQRIFDEMSEFPPPDGIPPTRGRGTWACTETTAVILKPERRRLLLLHQLENIADKLAEVLEKCDFLGACTN